MCVARRASKRGKGLRAPDDLPPRRCCLREDEEEAIACLPRLTRRAPRCRGGIDADAHFERRLIASAAEAGDPARTRWFCAAWQARRETNSGEGWRRWSSVHAT